MRKSQLAALALTITVAGSLISGCSTGLKGEQVFGKPGSEGWHQTASWETKNEYFKQYCRDKGINDDHLKFSECVDLVENAHTPAPSITCRTYFNVTKCQ